MRGSERNLHVHDGEARPVRVDGCAVLKQVRRGLSRTQQDDRLAKDVEVNDVP